MIVDKKFYNVKCDCCGALLDETYWDDGYPLELEDED